MVLWEMMGLEGYSTHLTWRVFDENILQVDNCIYSYMYPQISHLHCVAHVATLLLGICNECK